METRALEEMGLSKNEIKVYFALIDLVSSTTGPIIERAGIPHSKVYAILDKLVEKGLASFVFKGNVKHFQPNHPRALIDYLEQKKRMIDEQESEIKDLIPKFIGKRRLFLGKQSASVFEGLPGLKAAHYSILDELKRGEEYLVFCLGEELLKTQAVIFFKNFHAERAARGIRLRIIVPRKLKKTFLKRHLYKMMDYRFTGIDFPTGIRIFKDKVLTIVWGNKPTAFMIESEQLADNYRKFFNGFWKKSRRT